MNKKIIGLYVEILSKCNKRCAYCYNEKEVLGGNHFISPKLFEKIVDTAKEIGLQSIDISGGEPMLHDGICEMIEYAYSKKIIIRLISNFTLYKEKVYDLICKYSIPLQVTIDGHTSEIHDYTRGEGTFEKIAKNLAFLFEMGYKGELHIRVNLHKANYKYVAEIISYAKSIKASKIFIAMINKIGAGTNFHDVIDYENSDEILSYITAKVEETKLMDDGVEVNYTEPKVAMGCPYYEKETLECGFRIAADGYVYPCQLFMDKIFRIGNVNNSSLESILNGEKLGRFHVLIGMRKHYIPECQDCAYKNMCATGCPAEAYNKNKNVFSLAWPCEKRKNRLNPKIGELINKKRS